MIRTVAVIALLTATLGATAPAQPDASSLEAELKATFLYQFTRYAEWPARSFGAGQQSPFKVCVLAGSAFTESVDRVLRGEMAAGRPMIRAVPETPSAARSCHILYIQQNEGELTRYLSAVRDTPVLTVSDSPDFLSSGGHIALVRDNNRIRFDINLAAARQSGLTLRSQLLRVARKVIRDSGRHP